MTDWDTDEEGNLRPVLAEYDYDPTYDDGQGPYIVERWVYRLGFETVKRFYTQGQAERYAEEKAIKNKDRYRVLGPRTDEEA